MAIGAITQILNQTQITSAADKDRVYTLLYEEIKNMAAFQLHGSHHNQTLSPTVLAHECYIKVIQQESLPVENRKHLLNYLSKAMRRFIIDHIRHKNRDKRKHLIADENYSQILGTPDIAVDAMDLDRAIDQLAEVDSHLADLLQQKLFFEFTFSELADLHQISERQVIRQWNQAKALMLTILETP